MSPSTDEELEPDRVARFKALRSGAMAYRDGKPVTACPYRGSGPVVAFQRKRWVKGYMNARQERARANRAAAANG